ncbi:MAG: FAD-binding oxidoreductase [Magnetococcales bacterium]|nr:FAD-binding oxidoreductase [Magnetococcales bacterium]
MNQTLPNNNTPQKFCSPISSVFLDRLVKILASSQILLNKAQLEAYAWDNTGVRAMPQCVVLAENSEQVAGVLRLCNETGVPIVPRGAGTGNVGGALASFGGVVLSTQRMNKIVEIASDDRLVVVEPGVVNGDLQSALNSYGLFWPPDPSSSKSCTIGGNIAMCSAGPGAVRYGVTRDWVLGLQAVLADGTIINTGGRTSKGVVGYDMTRLLIGSEGTLAVVTQATLKLAPKPTARRLSRVVFSSVAQATKAVAKLMTTGLPLSAIEFLDGASLNLLRQESDLTIPTAGNAMLLLEVAGGDDEIDNYANEVGKCIETFSPLEQTPPVAHEEAQEVWAARYALSPILKKLAPKRINEDVVVPVSQLSLLIEGLEEIALDVNIPIVNFGHAGNGNIHVNLLVDPNDSVIMEKVKPALARIFKLVLKLDGSLSGEHGVGTQKRDYIEWEVGRESILLQRSIKTVFDPKGIMNPGKIFPNV